MKDSEKMIVTLTTNDLRNIISDVLDEKLKAVKEQTSPKKEDPTLYSRMETATLFGVTTASIDKWRRHRVLPPEIKIASRVYFNKEQIHELLIKKQRSPQLFTNF
jgi:hypothetical protein